MRAIFKEMDDKKVEEAQKVGVLCFKYLSLPVSVGELS